MGNTFANKKFVGQCIMAEDDGILINQSGSFPFKRGEIIFRPFSGDAEVFSEDWFKENFIQVDVKKEKKKSIKSPFEEEYIKALAEFSQTGLNQEEDQDYISGMKKLVSDKEF